MQSYWSYSTGQCCFSVRILPTYLSCRMCKSIYILSSIRDWYLEVKIWTTDRQYSFCLWIPWTKTIRILIRSTWMYRVMHKTCTKHGRNIKTQCIGSTSILLWRKDWSSIRHDRTLSFFTRHFQLIVFRKLFGWKLEKSYTRKYTCHLGLRQRSPWNTTGWKNWVQNMLNDQKDKLCNHLEVSQSNQPIPNPSRDRTGQPVVRTDRTRQTVVETHTDNVPDGSQTRSSIRFNVGDETNHDRTGTPVVCRDTSHAQGHEQSMLKEVNMDFRIPGLPHSVVKQAESSRVRELVKKIENNPHRHALQQDPQLNKAYNDFSAKHLLSIPEYVIKKGRPHGHRYGKIQKTKNIIWPINLKKRCIKKHFKGIHDRFLKDPEFRAFQLEHDRDEDVCRAWDVRAEQDHIYRMTESEYFHCRQKLVDHSQ